MMSAAIPLTLKSQRACAFCRSRKQTCDKALPRCSRCCLKDRHCDYSLSKSSHCVDVLTSSLPHDREPIAKRCEPCGCLEISPQGELHFVRAVIRRGNECPTPHDRDLDLGQLVWSTIEFESGGIDKVVKQYFATVQRWLPIVDERRLLAALSRRRSYDAEYDHSLPLLLLCMRLIIHGRCSGLRHHVEQNSFYLLTRRLFFLSQDGQPSLHLLQAGLLIAAYECGHGLGRASYLTLASCAALARALGFHQDLASALKGDQGDAADPAVLCWSAVVLLDRMIALATVDASLPLLVPPPPDYSFDSSLQLLENRLARSRAYERNHWSFEATAAAAELIGEALTCAPSRPKIPTERLEFLKARTEKLVEVLLSISQMEPLLTCEMAPLAISALAAVRLESMTGSQERCYDTKSHEELRSTFNMTMDTLRIGPDICSEVGLDRISFVALCSIFRTALLLARYFDCDFPAADFARLGSGLRSLQAHWAIGDLYMTEFDKITVPRDIPEYESKGGT